MFWEWVIVCAIIAKWVLMAYMLVLVYKQLKGKK